MTTLKVEDWPIQKVKPYPNNPRNNHKAIPAVAQSIKQFGWQQPLVVDKTGTLIVGHTRLQAAKSLNLLTVPVHVAANLSEEQVRAYRLADNRVGEIATWDDDKLFAELQTLEADFDLKGFGFSDEELGMFQKETKPDVRFLEDFEVMPAPKPKWILISASEEDCPTIMAAVKRLDLDPYRMEYSGDQDKFPLERNMDPSLKMKGTPRPPPKSRG